MSVEGLRLKYQLISYVSNLGYTTLVPSHASQDPHLKPIHRSLTYSSSDDTSNDEATTSDVHSPAPGHSAISSTPTHEHHSDIALHPQQDDKDDVEEDLQTLPLYDEHWTAEQIPDIP